jgi:hypothetical protein
MSTDAVLANRHARLRWVGAPLLVSGVVLAGWAIHTSIGGGTLWNVGLGMLGAGLSLASFGANHDAAMAYALRSRDSGLSEKLRTELEEELERDRDEILDLKPAPKVGLVMPVIAVSLQAWLCTRLLEWAA